MKARDDSPQLGGKRADNAPGLSREWAKKRASETVSTTQDLSVPVVFTPSSEYQYALRVPLANAVIGDVLWVGYGRNWRRFRYRGDDMWVDECQHNWLDVTTYGDSPRTKFLCQTCGIAETRPHEEDND